MRTLYAGLYTTLLLVAAPLSLDAAPLAPSEVPAPLRPWTDWVLHGEAEARCPFLYGEAGAMRCAWPSRLDLALDARGGRFRQGWLLYAEGAVRLPGDERLWPQDVKVDGRPAVVIVTGGLPTIRLGAGRHTVEGRFVWSGLPESLQVPPGTGLLALAVAGRPVAFPNRDDQGRLWLAPGAGGGQADDRLEVRVHRRVADEIPLVLTTRIDLEVSGRSREVLLGRALPDRFVPMALDSRLPARVEPDGRLRVQVRPGSHAIVLEARHEGPAAALSPGPTGKPWAPSEVWVFDARPALRLVTVEGVPAVDPTQTTLPDEWKSLPAYRLSGGDTMRLVETRRGDADPAPDRLTLARTLWLDFDGGGFSVRDEIQGQMRRSWRLEASPPMAIGRVSVNGRDQLITRLDGSDHAGVEIRQGTVAITADGRVARAGALPALGWAHPFQEVRGELHLPPGWRLVAARGADYVPDTWVASWSLLDLFLVLILVMAIQQLYGWRWAGLALAALVLAFPEPGAPRWLFGAVLLGEALLRVLGEGILRRVVAVYRAAAVVLLVLVTIPFVAGQVREALHPVLEREAYVLGESAPEAGLRERAAAPAARQKLDSLTDSSSSSYYEADPRVAVQTGPGLPAWQWRTTRLDFRGPVEPSQTIRLVLLPPAVTRLVTALRVVFVVLLLLRLLGLPAGRLPARLRPFLAAPGAAAALLAVSLLAGLPVEARAEVPSPEILAELKRRLLEKPACFPACAAIARLDVEVAPGTLRARLEVGAEAASAVPLPGAGQWTPARVLLDGVPAGGLLRTAGGVTWVDLPRGAHQLIIDGPLPDRDVVQLPLPLRPRRVTVTGSGWTVDGVGEDGTAGDTLQLTRVRRSRAGESAQLAAGALPPFVRVERTVGLGLVWQVETRVVRVTPLGTPVVLEVPLLDGESVTTPGLRVAGGRVVVDMGPQVSELAWRSILPARPQVALRAPAQLAWTEVWRLEASPVWHVTVDGIPRIHAQNDAIWPPEWRPWPGESLAIAVSRPEGLAGQSLTVDRSRLVVRPGGRATDSSLTLTLRSSRGGEHAVLLPEGATLLSASIDGATLPLRQDGRRVTIPVAPGSREVVLEWREPRGVGLRFRTPEVDLGLPSVNASVQVEVPYDRWMLVAGGPRVGPAVLFWSYLVVIAALAVGLGRAAATPLRTWQWLLLGVGLSQVPVAAAAVVVGWLLALAARRARGAAIRSVEAFNLGQIGLVLWTAVALVVLFWSIREGLLGTPDMQIAGNGSSRSALRWFADRGGERLPSAWVVSVPLFVYRAAMLAWALWLAVSLLRWLRWGWVCVTEGGFWRRTPVIKPAGKAPSAP